MKDKGYGFLPMKPEAHENLMPVEIHEGETHEIGCSYTGPKINLYNEGANTILDEINIKDDDSGDYQKQTRKNRYREAIYQDTIDYMSPRNNEYEIEMNENSYHYGRSYPFEKR